MKKFRVELAGRIAHYPGGALMGQARSIGARRGERVIDIGDAQDASRERDLLARESVRIARAVPALVVIADDRANVPGKVDVGDELESRLGMPLHELPFYRGELARIVQNLGRHYDITYVVQQRAYPEP